jgi:hypothetical protein
MRIFVIEPNHFTGDNLIAGEEYEVYPSNTGTDRQNKAWHSLIQEYWRSGLHSYNAKNFLHFRELVKLYLGAGTEKYYNLVDKDGKTLENPIINYRVKSWINYTKKERKESIDRLIAEMIQAGVNSTKFNEILRGMEKNAIGRAVS